LIPYSANDIWEQGWSALGSVSEQRSVDESRARSIWLALVRTGALEHSPLKLIVHVVGADSVEARSSFLDAMQPLGELLEHHSDVQHINFVLVGPNMPASFKGFVDEDCIVSRRVVLAVQMASGLYHDVAESLGQKPVLCILFNAGIWGYDSWIPTLERLHTDGIVTVVTSYNSLEAEDDEDVIMAIQSSHWKWLWNIQANPYGSLRHRPSGIEGRTCADNSFWQCFVAH
jgi:hypothetical protein